MGGGVAGIKRVCDSPSLPGCCGAMPSKPACLPVLLTAGSLGELGMMGRGGLEDD